MKIINKTRDIVLAEQAAIADTFFKRLKGLLARKELKPGEALLLRPCNSIHTFFMHFPIDAIFVDRNNRIIKTISCLKPWRLSSIYICAEYCVELPEGAIDSTFTSKGDSISLQII